MATIFGIINAIAVQLRTLDGMTAYTEPPGTVTTPSIILSLGGIEYDTSMSRGSDDVTIIGELFVTAGPQGAETLYSYLDGQGSNSLKALFEADPTLGDLVDDCAVSVAGSAGRAQMAQSEYLRIELAWTVMATLG
jgi:hypothetical protein